MGMMKADMDATCDGGTAATSANTAAAKTA
jgi:hypothetical protein